MKVRGQGGMKVLKVMVQVHKDGKEEEDWHTILGINNK